MARAASKPKPTKKRLADQIDAHANEPVVVSESPPPVIPSGCSLLNIALAENVDAAYPVGEMVNIVGDKSAGKTLLALTACAEVAHNEKFDHYDIRYRDKEGRTDQFPLKAMFGERFIERVEFKPPPITVEEFSAEVRAFKKPTVYVIDSLDSLTSEGEIAHAKKADAARKAGKPAPGSYGQEKAKAMSAMFRLCCNHLKETGSVLIVLSQVRENINAGIFDPKFRRNGGKALDFYAYHIFWLAVCKTLKRTLKYKDKDVTRVVGQRVRANITKNGVTGKRRTVEFDTLYQYGVDDIGAMFDFCIDHGAIELTNRKKQLAAFEAGDKQIEWLKRATLETWNDIEARFAPMRKARFE